MAPKKTKSGLLSSPRWSRLVDPRKWSLKGRFLYLTGALLALGCVSLVGFMLFVLGRSVENNAANLLGLARNQVQGELKRQEELTLSVALAAASMPALQSALAGAPGPTLQEIVLPFLGSVRRGAGLHNLDMEIYGADTKPRLHTGTEYGHGNSATLAGKALTGKSPVLGLDLSVGEPQIKAAAPVSRNDEVLGVAVLSMPLASALANAALSPEFGASILAPKADGSWAVLAERGAAAPPNASELADTLGTGCGPGDNFVLAAPLSGEGASARLRLLLTYDATAPQEAKWSQVLLFGWIFVSGAAALWFFLYLNVARMEQFLRRLKKILISSHSNYFAERFESDHVHCLDIMHCHNEECPVYQHPGLICYLETGSEAISPLWRNTCIYLNKYEECRKCPVFQARVGDELAEMRNVVNTMMRLWSSFLSRVGHLLSYVLRSQEQIGRMPSLDEISTHLEQMAKLTFFSRDVQGVLDKEEVYSQLSHVFEGHFSLPRFVIFEVDHDADRMVLAKDAAQGEALCKHKVLVTAEVCRARRAAEDVVSFYNPVLCPHFNCDLDRDVRCCMPLVMSGKVGAVFSFLAPRRDWEKVRTQIPVMRKYLDEAAPVLSSLALLALSKDQALRDPLTRCHNRRFLDEFITKYEPLSDRDERKTGLLMADLDFFKQVNDEYGHQAGDAVLQQVVQIIQTVIRKTDLLIRYGGEEFLVLLQSVEASASEAVAEKIRAAVDGYGFALPSGASIHKTISIGVAEFPEDASAMYKAIKFADVALYEAKRSGRNRVARFKPEMWTEEGY
ncbi:MAG: GGDEF domain-containing protein [Thermodesulfobacteriota bacterium]